MLGSKNMRGASKYQSKQMNRSRPGLAIEARLIGYTNRSQVNSWDPARQKSQFPSILIFCSTTMFHSLLKKSWKIVHEDTRIATIHTKLQENYNMNLRKTTIYAKLHRINPFSTLSYPSRRDMKRDDRLEYHTPYPIASKIQNESNT